MQGRLRRKPKSIAASPVNEPGVMQTAIKLHQSGKLDKAERCYRRVLRSDPDNVDALHFLGVLQHHCGKSERAVNLIRQAIALNPGYIDACNNLGNVLKECDRLEEAAAAYRNVIRLQPDRADAWSNLGVVLRGQGQYLAAEQAYRRAIELVPRHAIAYQNLGNLMARCDRLDEAVSAYLKVLELKPRDAYAYDALGKALYRTGKSDEAIAVYRQWQETDPDNAIARHMLAACSGESVPTRASDGYLREMFNAFAGSFDQVLDQLDYRAPRLIAEAIDSLYPTPAANLQILDAGCGTGLCGVHLKPHARTLTGVDLSPEMLSKARGRGIYDAVTETELTAYMNARRNAFDLIVCADTLCYFGDIEPPLKAAVRALRSGGHMMFTLERIVSHKPGQNYRLDPSGRYAHTDVFVRETLESTGFTIAGLAQVSLRKEAGKEVPGLLVTALA